MTTVFKNLRLASGSNAQEVNCFTVKDGRLIHVGQETDSVVSQLLTDNSIKQIDLQGRSVLPGFVDAHVHLLQFGISQAKVSVRHCSSLEEIRQVVRDTAKARPNHTRLLFCGWRQAVTIQAVVASMLDDLDPRPIYIDADDLHSAWLNTSALMELGLADKPDPEGGKIYRDENGNPSGLLEEAAVVTIVWPHLSSALSHDEKLACLVQAIKKFNETGITTAIDMAMNEEYWNLLHELYMSGQLTLRIAAHFIVMPSKTEDETKEKIQNIIKIRERFNRDTSPSFWVAGIKIICDGVVDACTAAISRPYMTGDEAKTFWDPEDMNKVLKTADEANLQCALHAIGDDAVNMAINGLESLGTSGRRHRIEHLELTRPEDAKRLGRLKITASIQPVHCDPEINDLWPKLIGHDLCGRAFAYKEFYSHGAPIAIGSDTPTAPHIPWNNIYNATTRRSFRRPEETAAINEHFKLSLETTLQATSYGGAYSCFAENSIGSVAAGQMADFIVIDGAETWESDPVTILSSKVRQTWLGGNMVWGQ